LAYPTEYLRKYWTDVVAKIPQFVNKLMGITKLNSLYDNQLIA